MTRVTSEAVLAAVREHGPITKTQIGLLIYGSKGGGASSIVERYLDDLMKSKQITLYAGKPKGSVQRRWVYEVTP